MREYGIKEKPMATYIIRKDNKDAYYWVLRSDKNYKTVAMSSESYDSKQGAKQSIAWTQANATTVSVNDDTGEN
jgi:uncharacterized protein YegP (UPF0339 family)